jgi:hypothetical protein
MSNPFHLPLWLHKVQLAILRQAGSVYQLANITTFYLRFPIMPSFKFTSMAATTFANWKIHDEMVSDCL